MRVQAIVQRVQDMLADKGERWETARILRVLSEGQALIARDTRCLRYDATIEICDNYHSYRLDSSAVEPLGGTPIAIVSIRNHLGKPVRFYSHFKMDSEFPDWVKETGETISHIVYDKKKPLIFRVYPTPDKDKITGTGAFNTTNNSLTQANLIVKPITNEGNFDLLAEIAPRKMVVTFFHSPPDITTIADTNLLVSEHFDQTLKHYTLGMLFRDAHDAQNRNLAVEELQFFTNEYTNAIALADADFVDQADEKYASVTYNGVIA